MSEIQVIEAEVKKVEGEIVDETKNVAAEAVKFTDAARIDISTEEKLIITKLENEYLKATMEIQRLTKVAENAQKTFPQVIENMVKKYLINPATHQFDNLDQAFKKKL